MDLEIRSNVLISTYIVKLLLGDTSTNSGGHGNGGSLKRKWQLTRPFLPLECLTGYEAQKDKKKSGRPVDFSTAHSTNG